MRLTRKSGWRNPIDSDMINAIYKKLATYEDAEEQRRLVEVVRCRDCKHLMLPPSSRQARRVSDA